MHEWCAWELTAYVFHSNAFTDSFVEVVPSLMMEKEVGAEMQVFTAL